MKHCTYCAGGLLALLLLSGHPVLGGPEPEKKSQNSSEATAKNGEKDSSEAKSPEDKSPEGEKESKEAKALKEPAAPAKPAPSKPTIHTVKKGLMKIDVILEGVFEAQKTTELILRPEVWTAFKVLKAVEHGSRVKRGDLLVALDLEKIDRAIADLRREHETMDVALKLAEQQYATLSKSTPMDLAAAERSQREAQEDLDHYFKVSRPMSLKSTDYFLKSAEYYLEYAEEELRQLEKMYQADDLTEETEEIILKRARRSVESAKFSLEREKINHQRTLKVTIPRRDVSIKESVRRGELALADSKVALRLALKKARLDLDKLKISRKRSDEKLQKLLADRRAMTVKAPTAGVVYHGKFTRGKYGSSSSASAGIREGSALTANQVFMTIVQPRPMFIRTTVPEKQLQHVRAGIKGTATPTGFSDLKLTAVLAHVAAVPMSAGSFDARITVALDEKADALMPGMTCKVKLVSYLKKDAITVPPKAVETDELDERKHYVHLLGKDGKPKKRAVTLGKRTTTKIEILKGLCEGDKILAAPPKKEEPAKKETPKKDEK